MITIEDLKENILGLKVGHKYLIFSKTGTGKTKKNSSFKGYYIGESGVNNEYYIFLSQDGYNECFLKVDFIIKVYGIKEISKKAS